MERVVSILGSATFWTAVSAIATAIGATAIILAARQLRFQAWIKAQQLFTSKEFVELRSWVIERDGVWNAADKEQAKEACRKLDEFARLVPFLGLTSSLARKLALRIWADPIAKCWRSLEPMIMEERQQTRSSDKWDAFETFGKEAVKTAGIKLKQRRLGRSR